jgi:hypothetical protein
MVLFQLALLINQLGQFHDYTARSGDSDGKRENRRSKD